MQLNWNNPIGRRIKNNNLQSGSSEERKQWRSTGEPFVKNVRKCLRNEKLKGSEHGCLALESVESLARIAKQIESSA